MVLQTLYILIVWNDPFNQGRMLNVARQFFICMERSSLNWQSWPAGVCFAVTGVSVLLWQESGFTSANVAGNTDLGVAAGASTWVAGCVCWPIYNSDASVPPEQVIVSVNRFSWCSTANFFSFSCCPLDGLKKEHSPLLHFASHSLQETDIMHTYRTLHPNSVSADLDSDRPH